MSSIRDIMDVDVDPLESQKHRRNQQSAAQEQTTKASEPLSASQSPARDTRSKTPTSRQRMSGRVTKPSAQPSSSRPTAHRRRSSAASMESGSKQAGSSTQPSAPNTPQGMEALPVKYTPVTKRVSKAKKGVPVHTCDQCNKTFTRAEHLRRHQLSHQKAAYPCTFQDCERVFHRPDLLARHLSRHETQGERPYKQGKGRSRSSSASSQTRSPAMRPQDESSNYPGSPAGSASPPPAGSTGAPSGQYTSAPSGTTFPSVNMGFGPPASGSQYPPTSQGPSDGIQLPANFGNALLDMPMPDVLVGTGAGFMGFSQADMESSMYSTSGFHPFESSPLDPSLELPTEPCPGFSYTNEGSPFYSSDSTYSTHSSVSGNGSWAFRGRSNSLVTDPDWNVPNRAWSPRTSDAAYGLMPENYDTEMLSPHVSPSLAPTRMLAMPGHMQTLTMESVGTPAPSTLYKPVAQSFSASPLPIATTLGVGRGGGKTNAAVRAESRIGSLEQLEGYLATYWQRFDAEFPIVHPTTFNPIENPLLGMAMAAIGTQFSILAEDRAVGSELHSRCKRRIRELPNWDLNTMCAIFLTEYFARFRSSKMDSRPSKVFQELYSRLLNDQESDSPFNNLSVETLHYLTQNSPDRSNQVWQQWIAYETRQRLKSACFILDIHQSTTFEQPRTRPSIDARNTPFKLPSTTVLWESLSQSDWFRLIISSSDATSTPPLSAFLSSPLPTDHTSQPAFTQTLILNSLISLLPPKDIYDTRPPLRVQMIHTTLANSFPDSIAAHEYMMLQYTPLRDLLALTGESWVLGRKASHSVEEFNAIKPRMRNWANSHNAAKAAWHASHVLKFSLTGEKLQGLDEYWALYVAALVCWAFGHRAGLSANVSELRSSRGSLQSSRSSSATLGSEPERDPQMAMTGALQYAEIMSGLKYGELLTAPMRGETQCVVEAVRGRLEGEDVGAGKGRCGMLVDAMGVLGRLGGEGKWF